MSCSTLLTRLLPWRVRRQGRLQPFQVSGLCGDPAMPPHRALTRFAPPTSNSVRLLSRARCRGGELAVQLRVLQQSWPPFSVETGKAEVEERVGPARSCADLSSEFKRTLSPPPYRAVHRGYHRRRPEDVAVKVLRPGMRKRPQGCRCLYLAARMVELFSPVAPPAGPMR